VHGALCSVFPVGCAGPPLPVGPVLWSGTAGVPYPCRASHYA